MTMTKTRTTGGTTSKIERTNAFMVASVREELADPFRTLEFAILNLFVIWNLSFVISRPRRLYHICKTPLGPGKIGQANE